MPTKECTHKSIHPALRCVHCKKITHPDRNTRQWTRLGHKLWSSTASGDIYDNIILYVYEPYETVPEPWTTMNKLQKIVCQKMVELLIPIEARARYRSTDNTRIVAVLQRFPPLNSGLLHTGIDVIEHAETKASVLAGLFSINPDKMLTIDATAAVLAEKFILLALKGAQEFCLFSNVVPDRTLVEYEPPLAAGKSNDVGMFHVWYYGFVSDSPMIGSWPRLKKLMAKGWTRFYDPEKAVTQDDTQNEGLWRQALELSNLVSLYMNCAARFHMYGRGWGFVRAFLQHQQQKLQVYCRQLWCTDYKHLLQAIGACAGLWFSLVRSHTGPLQAFLQWQEVGGGCPFQSASATKQTAGLLGASFTNPWGSQDAVKKFLCHLLLGAKLANMLNGLTERQAKMWQPTVMTPLSFDRQQAVTFRLLLTDLHTPQKLAAEKRKERTCTCKDSQQVLTAARASQLMWASKDEKGILVLLAEVCNERVIDGAIAVGCSGSDPVERKRRPREWTDFKLSDQCLEEARELQTAVTAGKLPSERLTNSVRAASAAVESRFLQHVYARTLLGQSEITPSPVSCYYKHSQADLELQRGAVWAPAWQSRLTGSFKVEEPNLVLDLYVADSLTTEDAIRSLLTKVGALSTLQVILVNFEPKIIYYRQGDVRIDIRDAGDLFMPAEKNIATIKQIEGLGESKGLTNKQEQRPTSTTELQQAIIYFSNLLFLWLQNGEHNGALLRYGSRVIGLRLHQAHRLEYMEQQRAKLRQHEQRLQVITEARNRLEGFEKMCQAIGLVLKDWQPKATLVNSIEQARTIFTTCARMEQDCAAVSERELATSLSVIFTGAESLYTKLTLLKDHGNCIHVLRALRQAKAGHDSCSTLTAKDKDGPLGNTNAGWGLDEWEKNDSRLKTFLDSIQPLEQPDLSSAMTSYQEYVDANRINLLSQQAKLLIVKFKSACKNRTYDDAIKLLQDSGGAAELQKSVGEVLDGARALGQEYQSLPQEVQQVLDSLLAFDSKRELVETSGDPVALLSSIKALSPNWSSGKGLLQNKLQKLQNLNSAQAALANMLKVLTPLANKYNLLQRAADIRSKYKTATNDNNTDQVLSDLARDYLGLSQELLSKHLALHTENSTVVCNSDLETLTTLSEKELAGATLSCTNLQSILEEYTSPSKAVGVNMQQSFVQTEKAVEETSKLIAILESNYRKLSADEPAQLPRPEELKGVIGHCAKLWSDVALTNDGPEATKARDPPHAFANLLSKDNRFRGSCNKDLLIMSQHVSIYIQWIDLVYKQLFQDAIQLAKC